MIIERNSGLVGALKGADPNSHSFQNPEWQRRRRRKQPESGGNSVEEDLALIDSQPSYRLQEDAAQADLGVAISFNQTQDAFLQKVQSSLERMGELSVLAKDGAKSEGERLIYANEFDQLQRHIQDLGAKMIQAADLFHCSPTREAAADGAQQDQPVDVGKSHVLGDYLLTTSDPTRTTLSSASDASAAEEAIHRALEKVTGLRARLEETIHRLNATIQQLSTEGASARTSPGISDGNVAEASTRDMRYEILVESGTAMLAQANALPQSALRLLR